MRHLPVLVILIPLASAFLLPIVHATMRRFLRSVTTAMGLTFFAAVFAMAVGFGGFGVRGTRYPLGGWGPEIGIVLELDGLSACFALLLAFGFLLVLLYSQDQVDDDESKYYVLLFVVAAGMMGMVLTADLFNLYVFIEMTSIASFALVAADRRGESAFAAFYYMVFTMVSSALLLLAIGLIYGGTGTLGVPEVVASFSALPATIRSVVSVSLMVGLGIKVALVPFHSWLPPAHARAVTPISALLSGVLLKTGIYLFVRLGPLLVSGGDAAKMGGMLVWLGTLSALAGNFLALGQDDAKQMLAYSSIAHSGYIALGIGIGGPLGLTGALFHSANHLLCKAGAFCAVGSMGEKGYAFESLRGAGHRWRLAGVTFAACTGSLIGLPPFGMFASKLIILLAAIRTGHYHAVAAVFAGAVLAAIYYGRAYRVIYDDVGRGESMTPPSRTLVVLGIVAMGSVASLVWFGPLSRVFSNVANGILG